MSNLTQYKYHSAPCHFHPPMCGNLKYRSVIFWLGVKKNRLRSIRLMHWTLFCFFSSINHTWAFFRCSSKRTPQATANQLFLRCCSALTWLLPSLWYNLEEFLPLHFGHCWQNFAQDGTIHSIEWTHKCQRSDVFCVLAWQMFVHFRFSITPSKS